MDDAYSKGFIAFSWKMIASIAASCVWLFNCLFFFGEGAFLEAVSNLKAPITSEKNLLRLSLGVLKIFDWRVVVVEIA